MYKNKRVAVLIAAAGMGERMGTSEPKQFLKIGDKTILEKATEAFENSASVDDIYIISQKEYIQSLNNVFINDDLYKKVRSVIKGGASRQESVNLGLDAVCGETDIVLIHDAARPYVSTELIERIIEKTEIKNAVIPVVPVKDTIKIVKDENIVDTPRRAELFCAQTPQAFKFELIKTAHKEAKDQKYIGTDDAQLVEKTGHSVYVINGEDTNIKITTPSDLKKYDIKQDIKVGIGFDVHAFSLNRDLILGGITIPYKKGLLGHSDADVLTHALMDALLGALNLGDIGTNFPDNDVTYKDISSIILLEKVVAMMDKQGYVLKNADMVIIAEKPKMKDYIPEIRVRLAEALKVSAECISVKATTTEGLGFTGREEGIGAQAIVQLIKER